MQLTVYEVGHGSVTIRVVEGEAADAVYLRFAYRLHIGKHVVWCTDRSSDRLSEAHVSDTAFNQAREMARGKLIHPLRQRNKGAQATHPRKRLPPSRPAWLNRADCGDGN
jgi:hypothetical protein